jgi:perosamine synthetase
MGTDIGRLLRAERVQFLAPLPPQMLCRAGDTSHALPWPLGDSATCYTFSGTAAIHQAVRALALGPQDEVLCPAYNCGHEVEPLLRRGVQVQCYAVGPDLSVNLQDLERRIRKRTRAVLLTHYFGFPQAVKSVQALCDAHGLHLIEDCAHALFSRSAHGYLGTCGDVAVFSIRKTLPVPNGGALVVNRPGIPLPHGLRAPPSTTTWLKAADLSKKWVLQRFCSPIQRPVRVFAAGFALATMSLRVLRRLGLLNALALWDPDEEDFDFDAAVLDWQMAKLGHRVIGNVDPAALVARRRNNYRILLGELRHSDGCRPLLQGLPEGVCPLFFPLLVYNRDALVRALNRYAIFAAKWWETFHPAISWNDFPTEVFLKDHVVALPVHQFLGEDQMHYTLEVLRSVTRPRK